MTATTVQTDTPFSLHPRLAADTIIVGRFPLCLCLLMNDAQFPWLILVPQKNDLREIFELSQSDQVQLLRESSWLSARLSHGLHADKINIGALGNMVPQLHMHHIARFTQDVAWPAPVWGKCPAQAYTATELATRMAELREIFSAPESADVTLSWV